MYWKNKLHTLKSFLIFLRHRAKNDTILRVASSLSYTSLIAIVPLFAIALAIFSAFPMFSEVRAQVQEFLFHSLAQDIEQDMAQYFNSFIGATAQLTTIGVVGIAVTAVMLLSTIEDSLNFIFKVNKPRRFATKITLYWTIITLGPLLLGAAFSLRGYLFAVQNYIPANIQIIGQITPSLITLIFLAGVYVLVPNKKVRISNALIGALVSVILFAFLRKGFAYFIIKSATYKTLYGAMAILPIFLVWMYLAWAVVIFGAVVTAAIQEFHNPEEKLKKDIDNRTNLEHIKTSKTKKRN